MTAVRTSVLPPYAAHLRVYEPLAAYPEPERAHWQAYVASRGPDAQSAGQSVASAALAEQRRALSELLGVTPRALPERESGEAFVRVVDGVTYVCPWRTRLRSWMALAELSESLPPMLLDTVLPVAVRESAVEEFTRWRAAHPDDRPWIMTSTWEIPVRWFVPFGDEDRCFVPGPARTGSAQQSARTADEQPDAEAGAANGAAGDRAEGGPELFYLTPMAQARRRVARAHRVLREHLASDSPLAVGVQQVGRWLEDFHPRSLVELDYGGLVRAIPEKQLGEDRSAAEIEEGIVALRAGDVETAVRVYQVVADRWRQVQALLLAN